MEPSDHSKKSRKALISFLVFWLKDSDYQWRKVDGEGTGPIAPKRLCFNNPRLNIWADQGKVVVLGGPFKLDPSSRYSVDSTSFKMAERIYNISVGLFAYFGPYVFQISALFLRREHAEAFSLIKPGVNFLISAIVSCLLLGELLLPQTMMNVV